MSILISLLALFAVTAQAQNKIVYGEDNRREYFEVNSILQQLSRSTAGMVSKSRLQILPDSEKVNYLFSELQDDEVLCDGEKFSSQPTLPICSGFLVASDVIATAGHCVSDADSCKNFSWVFDYHLNSQKQKFPSVKKSNVYNCKKIIAAEKNDFMDKDYALIQLDRPVRDRKIVQLDLKPAKAGDHLVMIGHPSGLPTKITDRAQVKRMGLNSFKTNLDAFHGNSGSAVFNTATMKVTGILVRGDKDYRQASPHNPCQEVNSKPDYFAAESVSHIAQVFNPLMIYLRIKNPR